MVKSIAMRYLPLFVCILFICLSCNKDTNKTLKKITTFKSIDKFSDSTYFSYITSILADHEYYYFSDMTNSRIVITNKKLEVKIGIGSYGEGPNEFVGAAEIFKSGNWIYAFDDGNRRLHFYENNKWIKAITPPTYGPYLERFSVDNQDTIIIYSSQGKSTNIIVMDMDGQNIIKHSITTESYWNKQRKIKASSHVLSTNDNYYLVIPLDEPIILVYDSLWKLYNSVNLANNPILERPISSIRAKYFSLPPNTTCILFDDVFLDEKGYLYLLTYCINDKQDKEFNIVMKYAVTPDSISYCHSYKLESPNMGEWYNSIAVYNDTMVAFEHQHSEIHLFSLIDF